MKSTGIVRKIDNLGRVVIPKEIRKNLKIKDFEDLEIFVEEDSIILKKYSILSSIQNIMDSFVDILYSSLKKNIIVTDLSNVVCCNKEINNMYLDKEISDYYSSLINKRDIFISQNLGMLNVIDDDIKDKYYLFVPIIVNGDVIGSIFLFSYDDEINESDKMIIKMIVKFLEKNIEE